MSSKPPLATWQTLSCIALLILPGCVTPQKRMAHEMPALHAEWQADVAHQSALPARRINWPEAVALLEQNNLKLRSARVDLTNSQEIARQVYRDLIPTISLDTGVSKSLKNIPAMSLDDVTFNIDSFFNIPGVVNFHARQFSGRLSVLRAEASLRLTEREQVIELYKLFLEARENDEKVAELEKERAVAEAVKKADEISGEVLLKDVQSQESSLRKASQDFQARFGDLLADRGFRWAPAMEGFPEFDYADHPLPLTDSNRVAQLQMQMVALELVGDWAQIHGIKLQYWPELAFYVTGPSTFQYMNNQGSFLSPGNVVASADMFWTLDTRGYVSQQLRTTRRAQDLEKTQMRLTALDLIDRLIAARNTEASLREQAGQLDRLLAFLDKVPPDTDIGAILQRAETNRSLHYQRAELRRELAEMNTLFWFVDEQKWAANTKLCMDRR